MQQRVLKLGTECKDSATGLKGTLTHWIMDMGGVVSYLFQPRGLTDEGQPVERLYLCRARLITKDADHEMIEAPFEILGSKVTDKASGFTGTAITLIRHLNGCFHIEIQPAGVLPTKKPIQTRDFDVRACTGEKIPVLTPAQRRASEEEAPSPTQRPRRRLPS